MGFGMKLFKNTDLDKTKARALFLYSLSNFFSGPQRQTLGQAPEPLQRRMSCCQHSVSYNLWTDASKSCAWSVETPKGPVEEREITAQQRLSYHVRKIAFRIDDLFLRQRCCEGRKEPSSQEPEVMMVCACMSARMGQAPGSHLCRQNGAQLCTGQGKVLGAQCSHPYKGGSIEAFLMALLREITKTLWSGKCCVSQFTGGFPCLSMSFVCGDQLLI